MSEAVNAQIDAGNVESGESSHLPPAGAAGVKDNPSEGTATAAAAAASAPAAPQRRGGSSSAARPRSRPPAGGGAPRRQKPRVAIRGGGGQRSSRGGATATGRGQARRRPAAAGAAPSGTSATMASLPLGAVPVFTEDFLRLNAQREKSARQLRRSVILREEEALLRARHTEDLADAVADLRMRLDSDAGDADLIESALADLRRRVMDCLPDVAEAAADAVSGGAAVGADNDGAGERLMAALRSLRGRLDEASVMRVMLEFAAASEVKSE